VALDRDGTLIVEKQYLSDPALVELIPGAAAALREFREIGMGLVIITNQSAIGRGYLDQLGLDAIHERMNELLKGEGVSVDAIYSCPHIPEDGCLCRKPKPLLLNQAADEWGFDPRSCFVIGDKASDIALGQGFGATTLLVRTGYGAQVERDGTVTPDHVVHGLGDAPSIIRHLIKPAEKRLVDKLGG
jgi:D-glycero-D-manno-heptose 1,7-bisphosphate phosphatase